MSRSSRQLPGLGSTRSLEETITSPSVRPIGARMYRFSPSSYWISAMLAERLGSYSMPTTTPGASSFLRLKSIRRYRCLLPPPRFCTVIFPWQLRPPCFFCDSSSVFSGLVLVTSEYRLTLALRRPGLVLL